MNKTDFIHEIGSRLNGAISKKVIKDVLREAGIIACAQVNQGSSVDILGLGKLKPVVRAERKGRNPRTGEEITIPSKKVAKFTASKVLKDALN